MAKGGTFTTWLESSYYNFKRFYSGVLLALVDTDYRFAWADVGSNGRCSDAQSFNDCQLKHSVLDGTIGFPDADTLPGEDRDMSYFIVPDDAFALRIWLMKPFSGRNLMIHNTSSITDCPELDRWWRMHS